MRRLLADSRGVRLLHALVLAAVCFAVYSNAFDHAFQLDSLHVIVENPNVRGLENVPRYFVDPGTFSSLRPNVDYRPLLLVSYALDHWLGGYRMWWWHFTQVLLHLGCVLGLYGLCSRVLELVSPDASGGGRGIAFLSALIFALHPTAAGVVDYLSARSSLMAALFVFGAMLAYMVPAESPRYGRTCWLAAGFLALALFTKVESVAGVAVLFLYDVWQTARRGGHRASLPADLRATLNRRTLRRIWPALAVAVAFLLLRQGLMSAFEYGQASRRQDVTAFDYLLTQCVAWWYYVWHWFAPLDLIADHFAFPVQRSLLAAPVLLALGGWALVAGLLLAQWKARPHLVFLAGSALALLSPTSSFVPLAEMVNEHRPYAPVAILSLVWMIPLGALARRTLGTRPAGRGVLAVGVALLLLGLGTATYQRNRVFATAESYWEDVVRKAPSPRGLLNYGLTFMARGDLDTAFDYFQRSLDMAPYWHVTHINLGILHAAQGREARAREHHDRAVDYDQFSGTALTHRGEYHLTRKRYAEAREDFLAALPRSLEHYRNHKGLATAHAGLGDAVGCLRHTRVCLSLDPERTSLDIVPIVDPFFGDAARYQAGLDYFEGLKQDLPDAWWVFHNIGTLAARLGRPGEAQTHWARANELKAAQRP